MAEEVAHVAHPEVALPDYITLRARLSAHPVQVQTSVNVLELGRTDNDSVSGKYLENLHHEELVDYFQVSSTAGLPRPAVLTAIIVRIPAIEQPTKATSATRPVSCINTTLALC